MTNWCKILDQSWQKKAYMLSDWEKIHSVLNWRLDARQGMVSGVDWLAAGDRKGGCDRDNMLCTWCLITGINSSGGWYRFPPAEHSHQQWNLPAINTVLMEAKATCEGSRSQTILPEFLFLAGAGKMTLHLLTENNTKILSCTKSTLFSLAHLEVTTTQGRSITQELAIKLAKAAHVLWKRAPGALTGAAANFLVRSHRAQAATWAPDAASSCKSRGLIWLHPSWSKQNGPHSAPTGYSSTTQH